MKKISKSDIFKNPEAKFVKKLNPKDKKVLDLIEQNVLKQKECLKQKDVNEEDLHLMITI